MVEALEMYRSNCDSLLRATLDSISANDSLKRFADSIIAVKDSTVVANYSLKKIISDNITIEALQNSQKFYNDAFNSILCIVSIVATVLVGLGIWNWWKNNKDFSDIQKRILGLEKNTKKQIESQKNEFEKTIKELSDTNNKILSLEKNLKERTENQNTEFSNVKEEIKKYRDNLFREIAEFYFTIAMQSFETAKKYYEKAKQDFGIDSLNTYFLRLSDCFDVFTKNNIELNRLDLISLKYLQAEINELYQKDAEFIKNNIVILISFEIFSKSFFKFTKLCRDTKKQEHLEIARDIWAMYSKFKKIAGIQQDTNNDLRNRQ